ncbi:MAG: hypothetical protein WCH62_00675, partial [Candidatus Omnitrophota bacterium]
MKKLTLKCLTLICLPLAMVVLYPLTAFAVQGVANVFTTDINDPSGKQLLKEVRLYDLDGSGYLKNRYVQILVIKGSTVDHLAQKINGDFRYTPVVWDSQNLNPSGDWSGIRFDAASLYYGFTTARRYLADHFGYIPPGYVNVHAFKTLNLSPGLILGGEANPSNNPPSIDMYLPITISEYTLNPARDSIVAIHEYFHIVFPRYIQGLHFYQIPQTPSNAINEAISDFWGTSILDEPRKSWWTMIPPGVPKPDFRDFMYYDDSLTTKKNPNTNDETVMQDNLTHALWALRSHPRIGKTNAEKIFWNAMYLIHSTPARLAILEDIPQACLN